MTDLQDRIWANKVRQGFNTTDVTLELCYLQEELVEFYQAQEARAKSAMADELADVCIFTYGLASMLGVDLNALGANARSLPATPRGVSKAISRVFRAWRWEHTDTVPRELARLLAEVEALAEAEVIDLTAAVQAKVEYNETRKYRKTAHGHVEEK